MMKSRGIIKPLFDAQRCEDIETRKVLVRKGLIRPGKPLPKVQPVIVDADPEKLRQELITVGALKPC